MLLILISVLPVITIMIYLNYRDKYEKEPTRTLMKAFGGGFLAAIATLILVWPLTGLFPAIQGVFLQAFFGAFFGAAIPEEFFKFIFLYLFIWKDKNFNEKYDGIIYAAFVSLGFACLENILYVFDYGFGVGIVRAILAVPGHALFGVIMGYYFSFAKFEPQNKNKYLLKSLGFAIFAHGVYDFLLMYISGISQISPLIAIVILVVFFIFIVKLWQIGFKKIKSHVEASVFKNENNENLVG